MRHSAVPLGPHAWTCYVDAVNLRPWLRCLFAALAALAVVLGALSPRTALAATPLPPLVGHVVDLPGALSASERSALNAKLESARRTRGLTVVVLVARPLEGGTIDDLAYEAFNTWGVGAKGNDDEIGRAHV